MIAHAKVAQDAPRCAGVLDEREHAHAAVALGAAQHVEIERATHEARPLAVVVTWL